MRSKAYKTVREKAPAEAVDLKDAVAFLQEHKRTQFDETVEIHVRLGVDASASDQIVRGNVTLPHGAPKAKRVVVITDDVQQQEAAKLAGAAAVGGEELLQEIVAKGNLEADVVVATPSMMSKIAPVAKILGPKGLMPNPKTGTVAPNADQVVKEILSGKIAFRMDQLGNIHEAVGKVSWEANKIEGNVKALVDAIRGARPAAQRGEFLKNIVLKSTMSPAIRVSGV